MARILVIEDDSLSRRMLTYLLSAYGHTVTSAVDGLEGIEKIRSDRPDLILCDIQMPRADGYQVCAFLKDDPFLKDIPIIAVTACAMLGDRERLMQTGFTEYISKPIIPERLIGQIRPFIPTSLTPAPSPKMAQ